MFNPVGLIEAKSPWPPPLGLANMTLNESFKLILAILPCPDLTYDVSFFNSVSLMLLLSSALLTGIMSHDQN